MAEFPETDWIWRNGEFIRWDDARVHIMTHAMHYGSSIFEGIRCYGTPDGPAIFRLDDHLRRFHDSCRIYRMELGHDHAALMEACRELVRRNELEECYIRPLAFRGYGAAGLNPSASPVQVHIICWPWGAYLGRGALENGVDVCVSNWQRPEPNTFPAMAKAGGNYINAQLMKMQAAADGYDEAIALTPGGLVSEGSGQNLFAVRDGELHTPPIDGSMLPGLTRDAMLRIARDEGVPTREAPLPREALYTADELFFTGTAAEVTPIRSVDRIAVGDGEAGPVTRRLQKRFMALVHSEDDPYGWRTAVHPPVRASEPEKEATYA